MEEMEKKKLMILSMKFFFVCLLAFPIPQLCLIAIKLQLTALIWRTARLIAVTENAGDDGGSYQR